MNFDLNKILRDSFQFGTLTAGFVAVGLLLNFVFENDLALQMIIILGIIYLYLALTFYGIWENERKNHDKF